MPTLVPLSPETLEASSDKMGLVLSYCQAGLDALDQATTLEEGQHVLAVASTLEGATRACKITGAAAVAASALRVRSERRVGELIRQEREAGQLASRGGARRFKLMEQEFEPDTLADRGITHNEAAAYTRLADVEPEAFEKALGEEAAAIKDKGTNVTRSGVLRRLNPEAEKRPDERWVEADRFITAAKRLPALVEPFVTAVRFGIYPTCDVGDDGNDLLRRAVTNALDQAATAIEQARTEMRRKN